MPRRIAPPDLHDDLVRLEPLARVLAPELAWLLEPDEAIKAFTYLPNEPDAEWLEGWLGRYEDGFETGERAGFAVATDTGLVGFAAFVRLSLSERQGEIGYVVAPAARGQGLAARSVRLLSDWGFGRLGLERIELRIDPRNTESERVAERCGYRREGTLRSVAFKEGGRSDVGVWSRLTSD